MDRRAFIGGIGASVATVAANPTEASKSLSETNNDFLKPKFETGIDKSGHEYRRISLAKDHLNIPYYHKELWSMDNRYILGKTENIPLQYVLDFKNGTHEILNFLWDGDVVSPHFSRLSNAIWFAREVKGKQCIFKGTLDGKYELIHEIQNEGEISHDISPNSSDSGIAVLMNVHGGAFRKIVYIDCKSGEETVCKEGSVFYGHLQMNPYDDSLIMYADQQDSKLYQRMYLVNSDGTENLPFYIQERGEWITHECWSRNGQLSSFIKHRTGVFVVDTKTRQAQLVRKGNYWHSCPGETGNLVASDSWYGRVDVINRTTDKCTTLTEPWQDKNDGDWIQHQYQHSHPSLSRGDKFLAHNDGREEFAAIRIYDIGSLV